MISSKFQTILHHPSPTWRSLRALSTVPNNPHIYIFPTQPTSNSHLLTLLSTQLPTASLSIGTTSSIPPTPSSFTPNPNFLSILDSVLSHHATSDPNLKSQAQAFASTAGSALGGGFISPPGSSRHRRDRRSASREGGKVEMGKRKQQDGAGGGGRGGWVHLSDERNPPDYGRIAWPEDIFGSVEVDGRGEFVDGGNWQASGTYRTVTNEGILGLSPFLRGKLVERLREEENTETGRG